MATFSAIQIGDLKLFYECKCGYYHKVGFDGDCLSEDTKFMARVE